MTMNKTNSKRNKNNNLIGLFSSLMAIIVGLLFGFLVLLFSNPSQAVPGFVTILTGAFTHGVTGIGQIFYYATPILLTGLSVGFAFKTGLFNIGASGQFMLGGFAAVVVGIHGESLGPAHWLVALIASMIAGALWAAIPGILNAYRNVNVVISCIMMNYIGMYFVNYMVKTTTSLFDQLKNQSQPVAVSARIPKMGLDKLFAGSSVNGGFFIAVFVVIVIHFLLNKTTFGFELKAAGFNRDASKYAGMNEKRNIILSMAIAGALSGLAGGLVYLAGSGKHIEVVDIIATEGFTGISVALLGMSAPLGILLSGLFIAYITSGGFYLQLFDYSIEIIEIITAVIIYFSAFSLIIKTLLDKRKSTKEKKSKGGNEV